MHHGDARAGPEQLQRANASGVFRAYDQHVVVVVGMRLAIVVNDFVEILARNIQPVGNIVVAAGENDLLRAVAGALTPAGLRTNGEIAV